jgi:hypothetical protein
MLISSWRYATNKQTVFAFVMLVFMPEMRIAQIGHLTANVD